MLISLDTECTGLDIAHGAKPFLVTICSETEGITFWEWAVDPLTREPEIPPEDIEHIKRVLDESELIYMQNGKFDAYALSAIGVDLPWHKVRDTLIMGHLLETNGDHDLTSMCEQYLGEYIQKYEDAIEGVVRVVRSIVKKDYPHWKIAREGEEGMPSVKGNSKRDEDKPWKNDMWLPKALIKAGVKQYIPEQWHTACSTYANADSEHTLYLGLEMERQIRERGLWKIYEHRMLLPRIFYEMQVHGMTVIGEYTENTIDTYERYVAEAGDALCSIAEEYGHTLQLAEGAALNDNMREFFYGSIRQNCSVCGYTKCVKHWNGEQPLLGDENLCPKCAKRKKQPAQRKMITGTRSNLKLPVIISKKSGNASLDKDAMQEYLSTLEGNAFDFVKILLDKRKHDTDLSYMHSYRRFWRPIEGSPGYYRIHSSINPCGTDHLRCGSNNPNLQNVGKQEDECEECDGKGCNLCHDGKTRTSVRNCFGPAPGRELWSMDYRQIENRIPPYECGEEKAIDVFEKPNSPPYWGSLYYLTASVLYADEFWPTIEHSIDSPLGFKKKFPKLYKQAKFFNLAKQYGAGRKKGDLLSRVRNSYDLVDSEFPKLAALQAYYLNQAEKLGYVETLPSKLIDPERGYPILAARTDDNRVLSTTPFNYHTSGTACECKLVAMILCAAKLEEWRKEGFDIYLCLEVHDELLFDMPRGKDMYENLPRVMELKSLMESAGDNLIPKIPTPVSVEYHAKTWAEGEAV